MLHNSFCCVVLSLLPKFPLSSPFEIDCIIFEIYIIFIFFFVKEIYLGDEPNLVKTWTLGKDLTVIFFCRSPTGLDSGTGKDVISGFNNWNTKYGQVGSSGG